MKRILFFACLVAVLASGCKKSDSDISFTMKFSQESLKIDEGETVNLKKYLVFEPASADSVTITWKSSKEDVAFVNKGGKVTGGYEGTSTITATSHGVEAKIDIKVVAIPIESYKLASKVDNVYLNDEVEIPISDVEPVTAGLSKLKWKSSSTVCTPYYVVEEGKWYVNANEYTTINLTCSYEGLKDQTCTIPVSVNKIKTLEISPSSPAMLFNTSMQLTANITKDNESRELSYPADFVWSSNDESVATVDQEGVVTAKAKEGSAEITCKHIKGGAGDADISKKVTVKVTKEEPLTNFVLDKSSLTLQASGSGVITVTSVTPSTSSANQISWSVAGTDPSVVTLSASGNTCTVKAKNYGGSCIVVATAGSVKKEVSVTVNPVAIQSVKITTEGGIMIANGTSKYAFSYTVTPSDATIKEMTVVSNRGNEEDYTYQIDQQNKKFYVTVKSSIGEQLFTDVKIELVARDGKSAKYDHVYAYIVTKDIYKKIAPDYCTQYYGSYGMTKGFYPAYIEGTPPEKLKSKLLITGLTATHHNSAAVQEENGNAFKSAYTYAEGGLPLRFKAGKVGTEYCTTFKFNYAMVDMNGQKLLSGERARQYRNLLTKYQYRTKEGSNYVNYDISEGGTIQAKTQKNSKGENCYNDMYIVCYYRTEYSGGGTGVEKDNQMRLYIGPTSSQYSSYKGTTKKYYLGEPEWDANRPWFNVTFNK